MFAGTHHQIKNQINTGKHNKGEQATWPAILPWRSSVTHSSV